MKDFTYILINKFFKKMRLYSLRQSKKGKYVKINSGTQLFKSEMGDYSYCGYDCHVINTTIGRFDSEIINRLLKSEWWNFDNESLKKLSVHFDDPNKFLNEISL